MEPMEMMPARVKIVSILKKALFSGEYKSGEELNLTTIAEQLGVSRTPVREAFQTLAAEGLIELRMNKGAIVKTIDEKFITDHYEMRILLESEAARKAAINGMEQVSSLLARLHHAEDNFSLLNKNEYIALNLELHTSIWSAADNRKLSTFLSSLWNGPSTGFANSEADHYLKSTQEHIRTLEYIKCHDSENAKKAMAEHITRSMDNILRSFQSIQSK